MTDRTAPVADPKARGGTVLRIILREPLLHFAVLGGLIFGAYSFIDEDAWSTDRITVTSGKIAQMTEIFVKTWQRAPTEAELKAMIDDFVKEELYVREALALGLDQDDTVIRRRLRQKMEFLGNAEAEGMVPTDAELQAHLDTRPADFEIEPQIALQQVFLAADRRPETIEADAVALLETLRRKPEADVTDLGDPTMLPPGLPLSTLSDVIATYGAEFGEAVRKAPTGAWFGPVRSGYGLHIVRVSDRRPGRVPALDDVRDAVRADWTHARRNEIESQRLAALLARTEVVIEAGDRPAVSP